jgi:hypothetical protein
MTYFGRVENGVVVLEGGVALPEGAKVHVEVVAPTEEESTGPSERTLYDLFKPIIGAAKGLPPDLAENHDHYLHGQPKR